MSSKERFKFIPAVYLVLVKENKVLLMRRANTGYHDGSYSLPAGHHDGGQLLTEAMVREAKEEIGITINGADLLFAHVQHRLRTKDGERIDFYYTCPEWQGEIVNNEPEKCDDISWHDLDALPENIIPTVKIALEAIRLGVFYSEIGQE
jgi:mutator protein MutT